MISITAGTSYKKGTFKPIMEIRPLKLPESILLEEESSFFHEVSAGPISDG